MQRADVADCGPELVRAEPAAALREHVRAYYGYRDPGPERQTRLQLPSATVGLIMSFGTPVEVHHVGQPAGSWSRVSSFVAGLHDTPAVTTTTGPHGGVQVDLTPLGAHTILGVPMDALANQVVPLDDVLGRSADHLLDQLVGETTWRSRFELLDRALTGRLDRGPEGTPAVGRAWRRLVESSGRVRVAELADEVGLSRQRLHTRFCQEIGLPPKTMARILRFEGALRRLQNANARLERVAQDCGYSDQSHLNRDFRAFTAGTPRAFLADGGHSSKTGAGPGT